MSWGCIVCGQSIGAYNEDLIPGRSAICTDCRDNRYMQETNKVDKYPIYVRIDDDGPHVVDVIEIDRRP